MSKQLVVVWRYSTAVAKVAQGPWQVEFWMDCSTSSGVVGWVCGQMEGSASAIRDRRRCL